MTQDETTYTQGPELTERQRELEALSLDALSSDPEIVFFEDLAAALPVVVRTLYNHDIHELQTIKDALNQNKVSQKQKLRRAMAKENGSTMIALYKLLGSEDECHRLNGSKTENTNVNYDIQAELPDHEGAYSEND